MRFGWAASRWPAAERWLRPGLALFFVAAGGAKLLEAQGDSELFRQLGYTPWFMRLTGAVQLLSGLCLLFPASAAAAAFILAAGMAGAAGSLLSSGNPWMLPAPLSLFLLLLAVAWHNAPFWLRWHSTHHSGLQGQGHPGAGIGFPPAAPGPSGEFARPGPSAAPPADQ